MQISRLDALGPFGCLLRGIVTGSPHPRISSDIAPFPLPVTFPYHNYERALTPTQSPSSVIRLSAQLSEPGFTGCWDSDDFQSYKYRNQRNHSSD